MESEKQLTLVSVIRSLRHNPSKLKFTVKVEEMINDLDGVSVSKIFQKRKIVYRSLKTIKNISRNIANRANIKSIRGDMRLQNKM